MVDTNMWSNQINYADTLRSCISCKGNLKSLSRQEYNEYIDLKRQHDEQVIYEASVDRPINKAQVPSKNYA